jgi:hypothetical protein
MQEAVKRNFHVRNQSGSNVYFCTAWLGHEFYTGYQTRTGTKEGQLTLWATCTAPCALQAVRSPAIERAALALVLNESSFLQQWAKQKRHAMIDAPPSTHISTICPCWIGATSPIQQPPAPPGLTFKTVTSISFLQSCILLCVHEFLHITHSS